MATFSTKYSQENWDNETSSEFTKSQRKYLVETFGNDFNCTFGPAYDEDTNEYIFTINNVCHVISREGELIKSYVPKYNKKTKTLYRETVAHN